MKKTICLIGFLLVCGNVFGNNILLRLESYLDRSVPAGFIRFDVNQFMDIDPDTENRNGLDFNLVQTERGIVNMAIYSKLFSNNREAMQLLFELYDLAIDTEWEHIESESNQHILMKNDLVLALSIDTESFYGFTTVVALVGAIAIFY